MHHCAMLREMRNTISVKGHLIVWNELLVLEIDLHAVFHFNQSNGEQMLNVSWSIIWPLLVFCPARLQ